MELIRGEYNLRPEHRGCVATIGNFDGVHLGHQAVFAHLREQARAERVPMALILGEKAFYGRVFRVAPGVLIPRDDTERLMEAVLQEIGKRPCRFLEIGVGGAYVDFHGNSFLGTGQVFLVSGGYGADPEPEIRRALLAALVLLAISLIREPLGHGTVLGVQVMPEAWLPMHLVSGPPDDQSHPQEEGSIRFDPPFVGTPLGKFSRAAFKDRIMLRNE